MIINENKYRDLKEFTSQQLLNRSKDIKMGRFKSKNDVKKSEIFVDSISTLGSSDPDLLIVFKVRKYICKIKLLDFLSILIDYWNKGIQYKSRPKQSIQKKITFDGKLFKSLEDFDTYIQETYIDKITEDSENTTQDTQLVNKVNQAKRYRETLKDFDKVEETEEDAQPTNLDSSEKMKIDKCIRAVIDSYMNKEDVQIQCSCVTGDTKIKLLSGEIFEIKDLVDKFNNGEDLWVYSVDKNGDFKPGHISNVWETKKTNELIEIILDNDKSFRCTPDHLVMLRDGSYIEAQYLKENDSLTSLYFKIDHGYESVVVDEIFHNYKVKKVIKIIVEDTPVYDISVDKWNNFYIDSGIILHNCEDSVFRFAGLQNLNKLRVDGGPARRSKVNPEARGIICKHLVSLLYYTGNWKNQVIKNVVNQVNNNVGLIL